MTEVIHRAKHISDDGKVSALCFKKPHAINLERESWTVRDNAVTCPKCLYLLNNIKRAEEFETVMKEINPSITFVDVTPIEKEDANG